MTERDAEALQILVRQFGQRTCSKALLARKSYKQQPGRRGAIKILIAFHDHVVAFPTLQLCVRDTRIFDPYGKIAIRPTRPNAKVRQHGMTALGWNVPIPEVGYACEGPTRSVPHPGGDDQHFGESKVACAYSRFLSSQRCQGRISMTLSRHERSAFPIVALWP